MAKFSSPPVVFPKAESKVLPDPCRFFSTPLLSSPLPTNSFFQNFTLNNGDQPEYIHPYLVKSSNSSLSLCYPSQFHNPSFIYQVFEPNLTISSPSESRHLISSYSALSLTLDLASSNLRFFLVRGSPFITCSVSKKASVSVSTVHAILSLSSDGSLTKHTIHLNNGQTWVLYSSSPIHLNHDLSTITYSGFSDTLRFAVVPDSDPTCGAILDRFSKCFPVSGDAHLTKPFTLKYKWKKKGKGNLLILAHPLHIKLLSTCNCNVIVLDQFKYRSIDGDLVGVVGDSWVLKTSPIPITWHSSNGIEEESRGEVVSSLCRDVEGLKSSNITTTSSYFYGKLLARAARLALITEEVCCEGVILTVRSFLREKIEPWLDGTFGGNGFLYETKWGGIVTKQGLSDALADFGFGVYNDHHYHLGYFLYAIAVLAKIDPSWGRKYKPHACSLLMDFVNVDDRSNPWFARLRCFDLYKLHSWAGGLTEFADGRNQESTSEAVNAYYAASLIGLVFGDTHLMAIASTLCSLEIQAARTWWHVGEKNCIYDGDFTRQNKLVGVLWANKRDSGLWFAPPDWRECRLGIQVLPLSPMTEYLFLDAGFVEGLVNWVMPSLDREGVGEGWKGFVYALEGMYDKHNALMKIRGMGCQDDGNSLSNLLWWIYSRGEGGGFGGGKDTCCFN